MEFSEINGVITTKEQKCDNVTFKFNLKFHPIIDVMYQTSRIWNYSLILTSISLYQLYLTIKLITEVSENNTLGNNISLFTVGMNLIWNAMVCTIHFYLALTYEDNAYEYGFPSFTHFLLFSIFELRLLFFVWKARNVDLLNRNFELFKKRMYTFYTCFCIYYLLICLTLLDFILFFCIIPLKFFLTNFWTSYFIFAFTFFPQIVHNILYGAREPLKTNYIMAISVGKLFIPVLIKIMTTLVVLQRMSI